MNEYVIIKDYYSRINELISQIKKYC